ncbi:MAG: DUF262 domain-containing protein [Haliscomenobacteraceae bacterium CHB4]|nr:DUF262 domain-containing protein [Haliscomenobacteraceae bacterium CHB4]
MTQQELVKYWSERLLQRLLRYREEHPAFTFALRQVNRYGRLEAGHWFQGDEFYIFIGFTARGDEDNKTRSVGLVFSNLGPDSAWCNVEVVFRTEPMPELVAMYRHIVSQDKAYYKPNQPYYDGYKYFKDYSQGDPIANLERFLTTDWPVFEQEARARGLSEYFLVSLQDFERHLARINALRLGGGEQSVSEPSSVYAPEPVYEEPAVEIVDESSSSDSAEIMHPFDASKIDIRMSQLSLEQLVKRLKRQQINLYPEYQRLPELWKPEKMSQLIESLLIRLPLPVFYFDGSTDVWEVVDGLQRLSAFKRFMVDEGDVALRLTGLEYLTEYNGKTFYELPAFLQTRIEESQLLIYIINPGTPDDIKYNIFKRINTGGLILTPQEIRNALNQGVPAKTVREMADFEEFRRATGYSIPRDRMEDCDFVTRFIGFYGGYTNYQPDLDTWLNKGLAGLKKKSPGELQQLKDDFKKSMNAAWELFDDDAFRKRYEEDVRRKPINKALFDAWSVNLAWRRPEEIALLKKRKRQVQKAFIKLMNTEEFDVAVSRSTGDMVSVRRRFEGINTLIESVLNN